MAAAQTAGGSAAAQDSVQWRVFLRALVDEIDHMASPTERDDMLRGVGTRLSRLSPLPEVSTLNMLQLEMNDALAGLGWGNASLWLNEAERHLLISHTGLPRIGSAGDPPGTWLSALLEGLYEGWLGRQPGGDATLVARRISVPGDTVILRYGRG